MRRQEALRTLLRYSRGKYSRDLSANLRPALRELSHAIYVKGIPGFTSELIYGRALDEGAADALVGVLRRRKLGLRDLRGFAQLSKPESLARRRQIFANLRRASRFVGTDETAFARFHLLICQNESLTAPAQLHSALRLARTESFHQRAKKVAKKFEPKTLALALVGVMAFGSPALGIASTLLGAALQFDADEDLYRIDAGALRLDIAWFDTVTRLYPPLAVSFVHAMERYCVATDDDQCDRLADLEQIFDQILRASSIDAPRFERGAIYSTGLHVELNILWRLLHAYGFSNNSDEDEKFWLYLLTSKFTVEVRAISIIGRLIDSRSHSEKRAFLRELLESSLQKAFEAAHYPAEQREAMSERIFDALLAHNMSLGAPVSTVIPGGAIARTPSLRDSLPKVAPAIWKTDKLPDDTPPDFIKRHYGEWLRADMTGLTRPDLRRLDPTIYMALTNFLRNNKLPADCPLPNKSEVIEREMTRPTPSPDELSLRDFWRLRSRQRARGLPEKG